jgi:hypothetical protein
MTCGLHVVDTSLGMCAVLSGFVLGPTADAHLMLQILKRASIASDASSSLLLASRAVWHRSLQHAKDGVALAILKIRLLRLTSKATTSEKKLYAEGQFSQERCRAGL